MEESLRRLILKDAHVGTGGGRHYGVDKVLADMDPAKLLALMNRINQMGIIENGGICQGLPEEYVPKKDSEGR